MATGYPIKIIKHKSNSETVQKFLCGKCRQLLRQPHQGICGHRYCKECLSQKEGDEAKQPQLCLICEEDGAGDEDCGILAPDKTFPDNAIRREMSILDVICVMDDCPWEGKFRDLEGHMTICPHVPTTCPQCQISVPREKMEQHLISKCGTVDLEAFKCPFGCPDLLTDQISLNRHEEEGQSKHLRLIHAQLKDIDSRVKDFQLDGFKRRGEPSKSSDMRNDERLITVESAIVVLSRDLSCMYDKLSEFEKNQNKAEEDLKKAQSLERKLLRQDAIINELQTKIDALERTSFDGMMIWRVENVANHKENALSGHITSIYSQPFYSSRTGYKMCARLYLNGDGMGKNTHISLFFVLMRGPYDAILSWPFDLSITFELLDLSGGNNSIKDTFRPDPGSSSFKKPTSNMNIASGCPMFADLSTFETMKTKYVKEDTLFIKIEVKPYQQSNSILSY